MPIPSLVHSARMLVLKEMQAKASETKNELINERQRESE